MPLSGIALTEMKGEPIVKRTIARFKGYTLSPIDRRLAA